MLTCEAAERLMARYVDDVLTEDDRRALEAHVVACAACAAAVRAQLEVAAILRSRVPEARADLVSRVSAQLAEEAGLFGLANWRAWTLGLAPVAAALMLAAYLGLGAASSTATTPAAADEWSAANGTATSVLMQPMTSGDVLLEAVLTGSAVPAGEGGDVR